MSTIDATSLDTNSMCNKCGKLMPSYAKFCYECGLQVTSKSFGFENMDITAPKSTVGKLFDFISIAAMATFGVILAATVGFILLYYTLFYLDYIG